MLRPGGDETEASVFRKSIEMSVIRSAACCGEILSSVGNSPFGKFVNLSQSDKANPIRERSKQLTCIGQSRVCENVA